MSSSNSTQGLYQKTVLNNGLRVISEKMPSIRSIAMGVWVDVGSRNESPATTGISHLIEHMLFKGTKKRSSKEIAESLESIGGSLNAFTSREQTCYTARVRDENLDQALDVLSDLTCNATLTPGNLVKEKKVVCEEIVESMETPSDRIHDLFGETYWGKHQLGQPILGYIDGITKMPRKTILNYIKENYRSGSIVIAAAGSVSHRKLVKLVKEKFHFEAGFAPEVAPAKRINNHKVHVEQNGNNQIHISLGFPGVDYGSKDKMTTLALHTYLGGGMSAQLFQKVREEKGLAYTVYTYLDLYRDAGIFGAYMATDKTNLKLALDITLKEIYKLKKRKLNEDLVDKIKAQLKGHLVLGMESTSSRMNRLARSEIMIGRYLTLRQTLSQIDKITASDIMELANRIFDPDQIATAVLGPADKKVIEDVVG